MPTEEPQKDRSLALANLNADEIAEVKRLAAEEAAPSAPQLPPKLLCKIQEIVAEGDAHKNTLFTQQEAQQLREFLAEKGRNDLSAKLLKKEIINTLKNKLEKYLTTFSQEDKHQAIAQKAGAFVFFDTMHAKKYNLAKTLLNTLSSPGNTEEKEINAIQTAYDEHKKLVKWTLYSEGELGEMLKEAVDALHKASATMSREVKP